MSRDKEKLEVAEVVEKPPKRKVRTHTIYTHGKVFKGVPVSVSLEDFLKEKYPEEYK